MTMDYLTVNAGEAKVLSWRDDIPALATFDLGDEFVVTAFNPVTRTAGLARSVDGPALETLLRSLMPSAEDLLLPTLHVRIVGGGANAGSRRELKEILTAIRNADEDRDIIDIVSADTNGKPYLQSFRLTPYDGRLGAIE